MNMLTMLLLHAGYGMRRSQSHVLTIIVLDTAVLA